jgi:hypothetical protein
VFRNVPRQHLAGQAPGDIVSAAVPAYPWIVRKPIWLVLFAGTLIALAAANGNATASKCRLSIVGGTSAEQAAAKRIVCRMPGTVIESVQIVEHPLDAPNDTIWLAITLPRATSQTLASFLVDERGRWEGHIAAGAIRDGFVRLGLRRVVAYDEIPPGGQPDPNALYGIALPRWGIKRWTTGAPSRNLGLHADSWPVLAKKLQALSGRYRVKTTLARYQPLGKAPMIWISTPRAAGFLAAGGFQAYRRALHFGEARYDGVFIGLVAPGTAALDEWATYRGRQGDGCGGWHQIRGANKICPSQ